MSQYQKQEIHGSLRSSCFSNDLDDIQNHPRHSFSFDNKQITSLSQTVDFLESHNSHECSTEALESRITSAAHAAHDVIESHVLNQIHAGSTLLGKVRSYFLLDLQKAINNMDFFRRKVMPAYSIKARSGFLKAEQPGYSAVASNSEKNIMVGFDAVRDQLIHRLTGDPSGHRQVIPFVGMGGIGKTTLAKNVYEHLYIKHHFDVHLWATISQQYSVETIFKQLSTTGSGEELHKKLWGRRYLIVLDDMWSIEAWEEIERFMPDNGNGSCVIVTIHERMGFVEAHSHLLNLRHFKCSLGWGNYSIFGNQLSSISLFWNVKTLKFWHMNDDDIIVSYEIWEMPQLRHLQFRGIHLLDPLPNQEECIVLQNLHMLLGVIDLRLTEEVCKRIPNIKNLDVKYYVWFPGEIEAICPHNLGRFNKLEVLEYEFYAFNDEFNWRDFVLSITIPSSLKKLSLRCLNLPWKNLTKLDVTIPIFFLSIGEEMHLCQT